MKLPPMHLTAAVVLIAMIMASFAKVGLAQPQAPASAVEPTWESVSQHYKTPDWFADGKFGIFMHWGLYAVPAHGSEWYVRYMYGGNQGVMNWHIQNFGPLDKFGYKDFIPRFTAAKWDPDAWAELFRKSGAKYIVPTAEHHDGFSLWDSALNRYNAKNMGPKRDLIGDLGKSVRAKGLRFGVSNHSLNHFNFIPLNPNSDQSDPQWAAFYQVDRSDEARQKFNETWVLKNVELIDKYRPDMLWFDGLGGGASEAMRLRVAAHYYNAAAGWGKQVTISAKGRDYPTGSVMDYERQGRILPRGIKNFAWEVDDPIGEKFGYNTNIKNYKPAALLIRRLIDTVSMNGNYLLNLSPDAEGIIDQDQQDRLLAMGKWLEVNGEAIYGTRPWTRYGEGPYYDAPTGPMQGAGPDDPPSESYTPREIRFTTKPALSGVEGGETLYAIVMDWPAEQAVITSLATGQAPGGKIEKVELLGHKGELNFTRDADGLKVVFPTDKPCDVAYVLKITGLKRPI
jgi:alpha-L-fucosidase